MKDLYTFDRDLEAAQHTYAEVSTYICVFVPHGSFTFFKGIRIHRIEAYLIVFGNKIAHLVNGTYANLALKKKFNTLLIEPSFFNLPTRSVGQNPYQSIYLPYASNFICLIFSPSFVFLMYHILGRNSTYCTCKSV
jgi:hypothetical protein